MVSSISSAKETDGEELQLQIERTEQQLIELRQQSSEQQDQNTKDAATTWVTNTQISAKNLATNIAAENRRSFKQKLLFSTIIALSILTPIVLTTVTAIVIAPQVSIFVGIASLATCLTLSISSYGLLKGWKFWANDHSKKKKEFKEERAKDFARKSAEHKRSARELVIEEDGVEKDDIEEAEVANLTDFTNTDDDEVRPAKQPAINDDEEAPTESDDFAVNVIQNMGKHPTEFTSDNQRNIYKNCMPEAIQLIAALHAGVLPYCDAHNNYRSFVEPDTKTARKCMSKLLCNRNNKYSKREFAKIFKRINKMEFRTYRELPETILEYLDIIEQLKHDGKKTLTDDRKKDVDTMVTMLNNLGDPFNINTFAEEEEEEEEVTKAAIMRLVKNLNNNQLQHLKDQDQECKNKFIAECQASLNSNYVAKDNENAPNRSDFSYKNDIKSLMSNSYTALYKLMDVKDWTIGKIESHTKYTVIKPAKTAKSAARFICGMFKHSEKQNGSNEENKPLLDDVVVDDDGDVNTVDGLDL